MEDLHTTSTEDEPGKTSWYETKLWQSCVAIRPFIQWLIVLCMFLFGAYMYQRDVNASTVVTNADLQKQVSSLKTTMDERYDSRNKQMDKTLTREVFEAYHQADEQRMERMEKMIESLLEHQTPYRQGP